MPARASTSAAASKRKTPAAAAAAPKPHFDFKSLKRDKTPSGTSTSTGGSASSSNGSKPTTSKVQRCTKQSGDDAGRETDNRLFVFNPRRGLNEQAIAAVKQHASGKDEVSRFNRELDGFHIYARYPQQARRMHAALRELDAAMDEQLDVGDWEDPLVTMITLTNLDVPSTKANERMEGVTAMMLDGYTYPLYKKLRALKYDWVKGVHDKNGVNRWVRVVSGAKEAAQVEKETAAMLRDESWRVASASGNAADWEESEDEAE